MKDSQIYSSNLLLILIIILTTFTFGQKNQIIPKVEKDICPFEGCQFGNWVIKDTLKVYANENDTTHIKFVLQKNDTIKALTGNIYYERFGEIVVTKPIYDFNINDTLIALRCTEGIFKVYQNDKQYEVEIFWKSKQDKNIDVPQNGDMIYFGKMIVEPKISWWVQIKKDNQEGWLYLKNQSTYCFQIKEEIERIDSLY